ncbi:MAG: hypothetical protein AAF578_05015 [Pseudomonadota bacterium]
MVTATDKVSRWHVASRVFAAIVPAFILANTASITLATLLPLGEFQSVAWSITTAFATYTAIIMWIFSVKRLRTVWLGLLAGLVVTGAGTWMAYISGAGA